MLEFKNKTKHPTNQTNKKNPPKKPLEQLTVISGMIMNIESS